MQSLPLPNSSHSRRSIAVFLIFVLIVASVVSVFAFWLSSVNNSKSDNTDLQYSNAVSEQFASFESATQLQNYITSNAKSAQQYSQEGSSFFGVINGGIMMAPAEAVTSATEAAAEPSASTGSTPSYTGTNVQVAGVDEPDIVKTDGTHIFVASPSAVTIINAYPANETSKLATISFSNTTTSVLGIEISQDRLLVLNQRNGNNTSNIDLLLYNTTDLSSPVLFENYSIVGNYVSARLVDGYLYAVIQQPSYQFTYGYNNTSVANPLQPEIAANGVTSTLSPSSIYYTPNNDVQISFYTMIVSLNLATGQDKTLCVLTGPSSNIYVSTQNIYVVYANYPNYYADADGIPGDVFNGGMASVPAIYAGGENSTIFRASYANGTVSIGAVGSVPGTILNQFSMNEYQGYFMVATSGYITSGNYSATSDDVFVLNQNMSQVAALKNIAPGENLYAVSFVGDMGYVVTFEQVDPLFAISFQNITNPVIESALTMNGYSDYLYPFQSNYLIGVGKDTVQSSTGNYSFYLGLKLSLFHELSNGSSAVVSNYYIGDRGSDSPALTDHLAFTFDTSNNIMVIPVLLAEVSANQTGATQNGGYPPFGNYVYQGAYVFQVNSTGFSLLGTVTQYPSSQNFTASYNSGNSALSIDRTIIIGNYLYTISPGEVMASNLSNFSTMATISLPYSQQTNYVYPGVALP
jgi:inhibitor of cysteine peptidase